MSNFDGPGAAQNCVFIESTHDRIFIQPFITAFLESKCDLPFLGALIPTSHSGIRGPSIRSALRLNNFQQVMNQKPDYMILTLYISGSQYCEGN